MIFQSTHPLRGATSFPWMCKKAPSHFNPRTPCGVRLLGTGVTLKKEEFQSTHPLRGATIAEGLVYPMFGISIHAPLAGCDFPLPLFFANTSEFQSTHPLRGATQTPDTQCPRRIFQSTHPLRGATRTSSLLSDCRKISIHAPLAGCDSKIAEIFPENLRKSYKISAKPNKERRCRVLGKGKAAAISGLARCEPPGENRNASGSHQIMSAPSGA